MVDAESPPPLSVVVVVVGSSLSDEVAFSVVFVNGEAGGTALDSESLVSAGVACTGQQGAQVAEEEAVGLGAAGAAAELRCASGAMRASGGSGGVCRPPPPRATDGGRCPCPPLTSPPWASVMAASAGKGGEGARRARAVRRARGPRAGNDVTGADRPAPPTPSCVCMQAIHRMHCQAPSAAQRRAGARTSLLLQPAPTRDQVSAGHQQAQQPHVAGNAAEPRHVGGSTDLGAALLRSFNGGCCGMRRVVQGRGVGEGSAMRMLVGFRR